MDALDSLLADSKPDANFVAPDQLGTVTPPTRTHPQGKQPDALDALLATPAPAPEPTLGDVLSNIGDSVVEGVKGAPAEVANWMEALAPLGPQKSSTPEYGSGLGALVDNPLTRGLAQSADTGAAGLNELLGRVFVAPVDYFRPGTLDAYRNTMVTPAVQAEQAQAAPADAPLAERALQGLSSLAGQVSIAGATGGGATEARAGTQAAAETPTLVTMIADALKSPQARLAGTLGSEAGGAQVAGQEAAGQHVSNAKAASIVAANAAANLIPLGEGLPLAARIPAGVGAGVGGNALVNAANGQPLFEGALPAGTLGAILGGIGAHGEPSNPKAGEVQPLADRVAQMRAELKAHGLTDAQIDAILNPAPEAATRALPAPVVNVDSAGNAATAAQADAAQRAAQARAQETGLTPDVVRAQAARTVASAPGPAPREPLGLPPPVVAVDSSGTARTSSDFMQQLREALAAAQRNRELGLTPDVQRAQAARAARIAPAPEPAPQEPLALPAPVVQVDRAGTARTSADFMQELRARAAETERKASLGLTPDVEAARRARLEHQTAGLPERDQDAADAALAELDGRRPALEAAPAPEAAAPEPAPEKVNAYFSHLPDEIGWEQRGGRLLRGGSELDEGENAMRSAGGSNSGDVIGRTTWIPKVGGDGQPSQFWRMRPDKGLTETQAHEAFGKVAAGEPLKPIEQRFIDYAQQTAREYAQAEAEETARFEAEQAEADDIERQRAIEELRNENARFATTDQGEAFTLAQWVQRAHDAGVPRELVGAAMNHDDWAQRLTALIQEQEHGAEQDATDLGHERGASPDRQGQAAAIPEGESTPREEGAGRGDLFPAATSREEVAAAERAKDEARNGLGRELVRPEQGEGDLLAGPRPEQARVPEADDTPEPPLEIRYGKKRVAPLLPPREKPSGLEVTEHDEGDVPPEIAQLQERQRQVRAERDDNAAMSEHQRSESQARGEREAGELGLRGAVVDALGPERVQRVRFVHDTDGLPENVRRSGKSIKHGNVLYGLHTADADYIFTKHAKTPERAVWTAIHETGGHEGVAALVREHPNVKVGGRPVREAYQAARKLFLQNPTVAKLARVIAEQRGSKDLPRMAEEAMAELQAATRTGQWEEIARKYGVEVPKSVREGVQGAMANFARRLKAILNAIYTKLTGKPGAFTDADVHDMLDRMWQAAKGEAGDSEAMAHEGPRVSISTSDLPTGSLADARAAVRAKARELFAGRAYQTADGDHIQVPWQGIRHGTSGARSADNLAAMLHLDDLIESAHRVGSELDRENRPSIVAVHQYEAPIEIDGRPATARLFVREHADGQRYYDHAVIENEEPSGMPGGSIPEDRRPSQPAEGSGSSIAQDDEPLESSEPQDRAGEERHGASGPAAATGVKNAQTKAERAARGLGELDVEGRRSFGIVWDNAEAKLRDDPNAGHALAQHIAEHPRALSAEETALLTQDRARISVERRRAAEDVNKAVQSGDVPGEAIARAKLDLANEQMETSDKAARASGYEQGLGLAIRSQMQALDYSLESMEARLAAAKGKPLDETDLHRLKDLHEQMQAKETELAGRAEAKRARQKETKAQLQEQLRLFKDQLNEAESRRDAVRQKQLHKDIAELARRIVQGDYSKTVRTPIQYNEETNRLLAQRNALRKKFDRLATQAEYQNKSRAQKALSTFLALRRAIILSGFTTLFKLSAAASYRIGLSPLEHGIQGGLGKVPGVRGIAAKAPLEGRFSPRAEGHALGETFSRQTLRDMRDKFLRGENMNDLLYGKNKASVHEWLDMVGHIHAALKTPAERNAFARAQAMGTEFETRRAVDAGMTPEQVVAHLENPLTQGTINLRAYEESQRAVFKNKNVMVKGFNAIKRSIPQLAPILDYVFPIVNVPSNYLGESLSYAGGLAKAAKVLRDAGGVKNMTADQADYIMRALGKQSVGIALGAIGWLFYKQIGSFYQSGDNKRKNIPKEGTAFGVPKVALDTPAATMLTVGANLHRIAEGIHNKDGSIRKGTGTPGNAVLNTAQGLWDEIPFVREPQYLAEDFRSTDTLKQSAGKEIAHNFIPPESRRLAAYLDHDTPRKPKNFSEELEMVVPGLRSKVPRRH